MNKFLPLVRSLFALGLGVIVFTATLPAQHFILQPETTKYRTFRVKDYRSVSTPVTRMGFVKKGRKPTAGNIRDSVFFNHGFSWDVPFDGGFLRIGHRMTDSARYYGWFFYFQWNYRAPQVRYYIFSTSALKKPPNYIAIHGEKKVATIFGNAGNSLTQQMTALKTNIAASDLGITPPGFGDLVFNQSSGVETILNGKTLREIVMLADSAITLGRLQRTRYPMALLNTLNSVIGRVNNEFFSATIDTISTSPLVIKGTKDLSTVTYLIFDSTRLSPWNKNRTIIRMKRETAMIITGYKLEQNFPNPFNPATTITYRLPADSRVSLTIYDALGREITTLVDEVQHMGEQYQEWNASGVSSGVYYYRLQATSLSLPEVAFVQYKKMVLLR